MSTVVKALADALLSQGPLGVVIAGMAWWIWRLQGQLMQTQERRVKDAFRIADSAHAYANALERNTEMLKTLLED